MDHRAVCRIEQGEIRVKHTIRIVTLIALAISAFAQIVVAGDIFSDWQKFREYAGDAATVYQDGREGVKSVVKGRLKSKVRDEICPVFADALTDDPEVMKLFSSLCQAALGGATKARAIADFFINPSESSSTDWMASGTPESFKKFQQARVDYLELTLPQLLVVYHGNEDIAKRNAEKRGVEVQRLVRESTAIQTERQRLDQEAIRIGTERAQLEQQAQASYFPSSSVRVDRQAEYKKEVDFRIGYYRQPFSRLRYPAAAMDGLAYLQKTGELPGEPPTLYWPKGYSCGVCLPRAGFDDLVQLFLTHRCGRMHMEVWENAVRRMTKLKQAAETAMVEQNRRSNDLAHLLAILDQRDAAVRTARSRLQGRSEVWKGDVESFVGLSHTGRIDDRALELFREKVLEPTLSYLLMSEDCRRDEFMGWSTEACPVSGIGYDESDTSPRDAALKKGISNNWVMSAKNPESFISKPNHHIMPGSSSRLHLPEKHFQQHNRFPLPGALLP
jgi:hypothetical protein